MSEHDAADDALERLEWHDQRRGRASRALALTRRAALTGTAAGLAAAMLDACGSTTARASASGSKTQTANGEAGALYGITGGYRFSFVSHARDNIFFTPTINGIQDACALLGCSYDWIGSNDSSVAEVAQAINAAVSAGVDGIATTMISAALAAPVAAAMSAGIPVITYNADDPASKRLAYVGQDLLASGRAMGAQIRRLVPRGARIAVFICTPGLANVAPRLTGIEQALHGSGIEVLSQASGASADQEDTSIDAFIATHLDGYAGYFGVDAGSTAALALAIESHGLRGRVHGGGFDLTPDTERLLADGTIQFTIDQQPYLQGFLPTLQLFLYRASQRLSGPADADTGIHILDRHTIRPYATTTSRYAGTATNVGVQKV
jgi:simple sugar transport system substrate-binding protein